MNRLSFEKRKQIINLLVEGNSLRAISRITDTSINTVSKLLVDAGNACMRYHNTNVYNIEARRVQCDEIWSFVYSKRKNTPEDRQWAGDVWTWVGIDADTKFVIAWLIGKRDKEEAMIFMEDVAGRLKNRVQLTTDGLKAYLDAVDSAFQLNVDYAVLQKLYDRRDRYIGAKKIVHSGSPNPKFVSTFCVERQNLTMRMHMRRFIRETNGFSKKLQNHYCAVALHFFYYNFVRIHGSLRVTPAMQAGLTKRPLLLDDIVRMAEAESLIK